MTRFDAIAQRYLQDARFHAWVTRCRSALVTGEVTAQDLRDAIRLAIVFDRVDREHGEGWPRAHEAADDPTPIPLTPAQAAGFSRGTGGGTV